MAPFICYEILYPEQVATRSHDADVLLTISNDAWFGTSAGPLQHFQMARMRALETGRWLLRGTNNGVTAVINEHGKVVDALPQFERDVLLSQYQPRQGTTPFMATGVWPWLLLACLMVWAGWRGRIRTSPNIPY
ncbi:MAG: apolipoprotein N-acyltransferase [Alcanivorax sp.]